MQRHGVGQAADVAAHHAHGTKLAHVEWALHGVGAIDPALKQELDAVNQLDFTRYASGLMRLREQREAL